MSFLLCSGSIRSTKARAASGNGMSGASALGRAGAGSAWPERGSLHVRVGAEHPLAAGTQRERRSAAEREVGVEVAVHLAEGAVGVPHLRDPGPGQRGDPAGRRRVEVGRPPPAADDGRAAEAVTLSDRLVLGAEGNARAQIRDYPPLAGWTIDILGTDISENVLTIARGATYSSHSLRKVPPAMLVKYFTGNKEEHTLVPQVKGMVRFMNINLYDRPRLKLIRGMDIVFCRNCLIYFDDKAKAQIVSDLRDALRPKGYLMIGFSETLHLPLIHISEPPRPY